MRIRLGDRSDDEILEDRGRILDLLNLEADPRQRFDDFVEGSIGLDMVFEPGQ